MTMRQGSDDELAFVDAGNLWSFSAALPELERSDVLASNLLAQLAADKRYSRFTGVAGWYDAYGSTLGSLAWQTSGLSFQDYRPSGRSFTLGNVILQTLEGESPPDMVELVKTSLRRFDDLSPDGRPFAVYRTFTYEPPVLDLQIGVSSTDLSITLIGLVLRTSQEIGRLFSERILVAQLEGSIRIATYRGALNEAIYARIRQDVIEKLGPKRAELILALDECPRRGGGMSRGEADNAR